MNKMLGVMCMACALVLAIPSVGQAQTQIHPEIITHDSRLTEIQRKLQIIYGRGRPLTTIVRSHICRSKDECKKIESSLRNLLLEAGAEPLLVASSDNYQFKLILDGDISSEYGIITQGLRLNFYDISSRVGERLIMSASATISCREKSSTDFGSPYSSCILDENTVRELFLRLR